MNKNKRLPAPRVASFTCEKRPATASRGMVVTNHPLASAAGAEMLLAGGNAVDSAVSALFALTVVEPMMVGILGGGLSHIRKPDGTHVIVDGLSVAPRLATADMYETISTDLATRRETKGRKNVVGPLAIAVPGALVAWCRTLERYGTMPLADVIAPAIRLARHGFSVTHYLADCVRDTAADLATDPGLSALYLPGGSPITAGSRLVQGEYADMLSLVATHAEAVLSTGILGDRLVRHCAEHGGLIDAADLAAIAPIERAPIVGFYRGHRIHGPPPPSSAGVHVTQMLNLLEANDVGAMGFGSADAVHLLAEALKIAFADRAVATADPAFVDVPVARLIDKAYAAERLRHLSMERTRDWGPGIATRESADTTHVTVADKDGTIVASTQTINDVFGARVMIPGTGAIANNYMLNFDPHPGNALSIAPGKRVFTSMSPTIVTKDGKPVFALGLPGGLRIFPSAFQAIVNMIDHGMSPQEAVEAPRVWTEGGVLEVEDAIPDATVAALTERGHRVQRVKRVAGGMSMIRFHEDGTLEGAACWRADGTPVGISGGLARPGVRFTIA